jgi:hypothetical protein
MSLRRGNDLESLRDEFFADRPIGIGSSLANDDWEELETTFKNLDEEELVGLDLEELKNLTFNTKG